ncbi:MAG: di-heme oxidoredictase family protein [Pseudomonadota bacterium]
MADALSQGDPYRSGFLAMLGAACIALILTSSGASIDNAHPALDLLRPGGEWLTFDADRFGPLLLDVDLDTIGDVNLSRGRELYFRDWLEREDGSEPLAGPDLDASTCAACHVETQAASRGNGVRIAKPVLQAHRDRYGAQLTQRVHGSLDPEAAHSVRWLKSEFTYANGDRQSLRKPAATARTRDGETIPVGLRTAPLLFGWGLIEQVPTAMLDAFHDPEDRDGNGISGMLGRSPEGVAIFGWKGSQHSLHGQITAALRNDMGVEAEPHANQSADPEITGEDLQSITRYVAHLGVPQRRPVQEYQRGELLFGNVGCASCHVPALITAKGQNEMFSDQLIWPYSDLARHDMGPALSDPGDAPDASEWRTAPLWGLGIAEARLPERGFLHDGRAANLEEAILWHGGEAEPARDRFATLTREDREILLAFVRSL